MSSKVTSLADERSSSKVSAPGRRFPEFREAGAWETVSLGSVASISTKKVEDKTCVPMSITSGVGLVSQMEKFGRIIAGDSYRNYLVLQNNDFAYNKSATKEYPEGFIALYVGEELGAVPNSIFTCFRIKGGSPSLKYLNYLFLGNLHGRWLRKFIEVGARAHGSLSINDRDLLALPVPIPSGPSSLKEQEKIADCLTSLDALIEAQGRKVEVLRAHKKGLMQQLFPQDGETQPRLRFHEFHAAGEWEPRTLGSVCTSFSGGTPSTLHSEYYGGEIPFIRSAEIGRETTELFLTRAGLENSAAKMVKKGDVLVALYGANSGDVAIARISGAINQAILCLRPSGSAEFLSQFLAYRKDWIITKYLQGGQGNLSGEILKSITLVFPSPREQQRIADCLIFLDDLIAAETRKLDTLKTHKKGLMQQLFPLVGEDDA